MALKFSTSFPNNVKCKNRCKTASIDFAKRDTKQSHNLLYKIITTFSNIHVINQSNCYSFKSLICFFKSNVFINQTFHKLKKEEPKERPFLDFFLRQS